MNPILPVFPTSGLIPASSDKPAVCRSVRALPMPEADSTRPTLRHPSVSHYRRGTKIAVTRPYQQVPLACVRAPLSSATNGEIRHASVPANLSSRDGGIGRPADALYQSDWGVPALL